MILCRFTLGPFNFWVPLRHLSEALVSSFFALSLFIVFRRSKYEPS